MFLIPLIIENSPLLNWFLVQHLSLSVSVKVSVIFHLDLHIVPEHHAPRVQNNRLNGQRLLFYFDFVILHDFLSSSLWIESAYQSLNLVLFFLSLLLGVFGYVFHQHEIWTLPVSQTGHATQFGNEVDDFGFILSVDMFEERLVEISYLLLVPVLVVGLVCCLVPIP